jgi:hypothetical protein
MAAKKTIFQKISDDAVRAKTDRVWREWFSILDKFGLKKKGHTQAAKYLRDKHGLSDWWAQAVTIRYEWEKGLRPKRPRALREGKLVRRKGKHPVITGGAKLSAEQLAQALAD